MFSRSATAGCDFMIQKFDWLDTLLDFKWLATSNWFLDIFPLKRFFLISKCHLKVQPQIRSWSVFVAPGFFSGLVFRRFQMRETSTPTPPAMRRSKRSDVSSINDLFFVQNICPTYIKINQNCTFLGCLFVFVGCSKKEWCWLVSQQKSNTMRPAEAHSSFLTSPGPEKSGKGWPWSLSLAAHQDLKSKTLPIIHHLPLFSNKHRFSTSWYTLIYSKIEYDILNNMHIYNVYI